MRDEDGGDAEAITPALVPPASRPVVFEREGTSLEVHPLTGKWLTALRQFNAGLSDCARSVFLPHAYDDVTLARYAERARRGQDRAYVLCSGEEVVGYFFLWEFDQRVPVLGVGLADAWQGKGLGGPIIRLLIRDARAANRDAIELTTVLTNERALNLYLRLGFEEVGETDNVAGDGRVVRERRMFLPLKPGARPSPRTFQPPG